MSACDPAYTQLLALVIAALLIVLLGAWYAIRDRDKKITAQAERIAWLEGELHVIR